VVVVSETAGRDPEDVAATIRIKNSEYSFIHVNVGKSARYNVLTAGDICRDSFVTVRKHFIISVSVGRA
jgi:hypothetical protein